MTTTSPAVARSTAASAGPDTRGGKIQRRTPQAWFFLAPFVGFYALFMVGPMIWMFIASFFNTSTVHPGLGSFAGLDNYIEMFNRDDFWSSLWHTLQFTLYTVPPLVIVSFIMAVLTNRAARAQWFFRLAFFLPFILPSATISLIWVFIFTPSNGLWSLPGQLFGLEPGAGMLASPRTAMIGIAIFVFIGAWNNFLWPFIVINDSNLMTLPTGLQTVVSAYGIQYAQNMAQAVLAALPLIIVFMFFQRQIIKSVATTGITGT